MCIMSTTCNECGNEYVRIARHWLGSSCEPPPLSDKQQDVLTGLMMGDGTIGRSSAGTPRIEVNMITPEYLHYLDNMFPILGRGVRLVNSAKENAERDSNSGFNDTASEENYSDTHRWQTVSYKIFDQFDDWYTSGTKVWPKVDLTPTVLKHLYCCDGYRHDSGSHNNVTISMNNEIDNTDKVDKMFQDADLPAPSWQIYEKNGRDDCSARFTKSDSLKLWNYMGEPLPGFEYKWP